MEEHLTVEKASPAKEGVKESENVHHQENPLKNISQPKGAVDPAPSLHAYSTNGESCLKETKSSDINDSSLSKSEKCSIQYPTHEQYEFVENEVPLIVTESSQMEASSPEKNLKLSTEYLNENINNLEETLPNSSNGHDNHTSVDHSSPQKDAIETDVIESEGAAKLAHETEETVASSVSSLISSPATTSATLGSPTTLSKSSIYQVKWINSNIEKLAKDVVPNINDPTGASHSGKISIVTQNENGPCPLLSIVNVLLLQRKLTLPEGCEVISAEQLLEYIGGVIVDSVPNDLAESRRLDYEQNVQDAISILPKLQTGLDVNVRFTGVSDFEYTEECIIFDLLNISLYHGWLLDPQEENVATAIHSLSYNQLVETIIDNKHSADQELVTQSLIASQFLEDNGSQLTYHGLCELNSTLKDRELAVLFRNNHFSVMLKRRNELFLLVTDQGYLKEPNVVWETLSSVDGAGHYVDHRFVTFTPASIQSANENSSVLSSVASEQTNSANRQAQALGNGNQTAATDLSILNATSKANDDTILPDSSDNKNQIDQDLLLAMTLAEEDEKRFEREKEWEDFKNNSLGAGGDSLRPGQLTDEELAQRLQDEENRVAQQVQEEQNGRSRINNQPPSSAVENNMPSTSSSSRQVERHESQRTKNCTIL